MDIIEKVNSVSSWVRPVEVVPKPNGEIVERMAEIAENNQSHSLDNVRPAVSMVWHNRITETGLNYRQSEAVNSIRKVVN
ncbi:hypothetical protein P5673_022338, partial [Acropora cervicornis]